MPYEIRKTGPKSKPWCVFNKITKAKKGCSATEAMAKKFMAKLYLEESKKGLTKKAFDSLSNQEKLDIYYDLVERALIDL